MKSSVRKVSTKVVQDHAAVLQRYVSKGEM